MTKPKGWTDLARALDADWQSDHAISLTGLVAEARAVEWDFTVWCYANGYDAGDPAARSMFECLLAYAKLEGRAGLH